MIPIEVRSLSEPPEIRTDQNGRLVASGIAIRYGVRSDRPIGGRFYEEIRSGAATKTIAERDVMALHEHQRHLMLGRTSAGTLRLTNDADELRYEIDLPDTTAGRDVAVQIERRDVQGSSFGFVAVPKSVKWSVTDDGMALRSVGELSLDHIAPTCAPVYTDTPVEMALRSLADDLGIEFSVVAAAAERNELRTVIAPPEGDAPPDQSDAEDGRATPTVHRRPSFWFA